MEKKKNGGGFLTQSRLLPIDSGPGPPVDAMSDNSSDAGGGVAGAEEVALVPMDQKPPAEMPAKGGGTAAPAQTTPAAAPAAVDPDVRFE